MVGSSFGAAVALRLVARRPDLLGSLVAHGPPLFALLAGDPDTREPLTRVSALVAAVAERLTAGDMTGGARQFVARVTDFIRRAAG